MNPSHDHIPDQGRLDASTVDKLRQTGVIRNLKQTSGPELQERKSPSRIMHVGNIYYISRSGQPHVTEIRSNRNQVADEQAFGPRRMTIGEEWTPIETGWIEVCGMMILTNEEGRRLQRIPTAEQIEEINGKVVEIAFVKNLPVSNEPRTMHSPPIVAPDEPFAALLLLPGESLPATPVSMKQVLVRCRAGQARITVNLLPG